jgi:fluoride exporter
MGMSTSSISIVAIFFGAGLGALLRAWFNVLAESFSSTIPAGTLIANLLGAYLVGIALAYYMDQPTISPQWRLFIITGFLGGLTTFSSFSADVVMLMQRDQLMLALGLALMHVCGSLLLTFLGIWTIHALK